MDEYTMYLICMALTSITNHECCSYGFDTECDLADKFIEEYESENPDVAKKYNQGITVVEFLIIATLLIISISFIFALIKYGGKPVTEMPIWMYWLLK